MEPEPDQLQRRRETAEQIQLQVRRYIEKLGWDVAEEEERWRHYQQAQMADEYKDDEW